MKIAIIVHSSTGTTRKFADRIAVKLSADGHDVKVTQLETDVPVTSGSTRKCREFRITNLPDIKACDVVLFGGPVWGFSASPIIIACIEAFDDLQGKRVLPFVTQGFPFAFMGGNQAKGVMGKRAAGKKATVLRGVVINRLFHDIDSDMEKAAGQISSMLKTAASDKPRR